MILQRVALLIAILIYVKYTHSASVLLDWTSDVPEDDNFAHFLVDYNPAVGTPPTHFKLPPTTTGFIVRNTLSETRYNCTITGIRRDGSAVRIASNTNLESHPDSPKLESVTSTETEAIVAYIPPEGNNLTFYIKYAPVNRIEQANVIETKATLVKLQNLQPATKFSLQIFSMQNGVLSLDSMETFFSTEDVNSDNMTYSIRTLPVNFTLPPTTSQQVSVDDWMLSTVQPQLSHSFPVEITEFWETSTETTTTLSTIRKSVEEELPVVAESQEVDAASYYASTVPIVEPSTTTVGSTTATAITATSQLIQISADSQEINNTSEDETTVSKQNTDAEQETVLDPVDSAAIETEEHSDKQQIKSTLPIMHSTTAPDIDSDVDVSLLPEPVAEIFLTKEGSNIRVDWDLSEDTVCDGFRFKYTILSLSRPKTYSVETTIQETVIKMLPEHKLELRVYCLLEGAISQTWWARRVVDLSRPTPVNNLRIVRAVTDEFYVAKIIINWDWPKYGHNFEINRLVVSYAKGKVVNKKNKKEIEVESNGAVVIEKLDPNELYTITVRNISRELDISSQAKTVRQITPPVITSTLYPGQISSTAININFGESDPEHPFDKYELIFSGNSKNITKTLDKDDEKSLTFTRLIPGKTYDFELYTIYKGIKSRAVTANVTTYPLKVDKLFPVVGKNYVALYWDVQNFVNSNCRFRLSYTGTSNSGHQSSGTVELNNTNKYRFNNLDVETYYTFTITVIMGVGDAKAESESEMVTVGISASGRSLPVVQRYGTRELAVTFENDQNAFADTNGVIDNYAIIVTENVKLEGDDYELKSWFEVRDEEHWPPYRASASDYNPFKKQRKSKSVTFIVGAEDCEKRRLDEQYCNGMLRANVDYYIKIRSYSVSNIAMETEWVSISGAATSNEESTESGRRLPCHMYLNGCPRKNAVAIYDRSNKYLLMSIIIVLPLLQL